MDVATPAETAPVALGGVMGALYATEDGLAQALLAAAAASGAVAVPLVDDLQR